MSRIAAFAACVFTVLLAGGASAQTGGRQGAPPDTLAPRRDSLMNLVLAKIQGRENEPAEAVFKNIKILTGTPAGRLPRIMNGGFSRNLGVSCEHCHNLDDYSLDEKKEKDVARGMFQMVNRINGEILPSIQGIKSERPNVNCGMCHRGTARPGVNPGRQGGPGR